MEHFETSLPLLYCDVPGSMTSNFVISEARYIQHAAIFVARKLAMNEHVAAQMQHVCHY